MLVLVRHPIGAGAGVLGLLTLALLVLSTLDGRADGVRGGDRRVLEIRAESASLIASDLAGFQERRRREGRGYARGTEALVSSWLTQFDRRERGGMRDWTEYHGVHASASGSRFVVETSSGPGTDGWYRLTVDRRAGRVTARCGGDPAPGCSRGRWRIGTHGLPRSYYSAGDSARRLPDARIDRSSRGLSHRRRDTRLRRGRERGRPEALHSRSQRGELVADAPSVVAYLASSMEQYRRSGSDYTPGTEELAATRRSTGMPQLEVRTTDSGFVIEAREELPPGAWVRLAVDRQARRVTATCGGPPTVYCTDGRWPIEEFGVDEAYLLGD